MSPWHWDGKCPGAIAASDTSTTSYYFQVIMTQKTGIERQLITH